MKRYLKKFIIGKNVSIKKVITQLNKTGRKCLIVSNNKKQLLGTISDGDVRKALLVGKKMEYKILDVYNKNPIYFSTTNYSPGKAKKIFKSKHIDLIPILDIKNKISNIIFWDDHNSLKNFNKMNIPVVVMAGGFGKRLHPITRVIPKPLIPFNDKTVIEKIIDNFFTNGSKLFYLIVNYKSKIIKAYFNDLDLKYDIKFVEEKKPLGTVGGIYILKRKITRDFVITNCDIIANIDYSDFMRFHKLNQNDITIVASSKSHTVPYGVIEIEKNQDLLKINEKPQLDFLINVGIYALKPSTLDYIPKNTYFDMTDLISLLKKENKKVGIYTIYEDRWFDVGQWKEYESTISKKNL